MEERGSSNTALGVAALRAAHQVLDAEPRILEDPIAVRLLDEGILERMRQKPAFYQSPGVRGLRSHVVLRSRFAEDALARAAARGVAQYVVLGAGLDTFAYRQPGWARSLSILEVDHPASQRAKRERLATAGVELPSNLEFAPIDFELDSLESGLARSGFDPARPAFFSWLGVTMYLTEPAIDAVFRYVAGLPAGSALAFTFAPPEEVRAPGSPSLSAMAAAVGEPWLTRFTPEQLEPKLRGFGFSRVAFLSPADAAPHFEGRSDRLPPPRRTTIALAEV